MTREIDLPLKEECPFCFGTGLVQYVNSPVYGTRKIPCHNSECKSGYLDLPLLELELEDEE